MRQLASIQTVNLVEVIDGADAIEKIRVLGWWVVVKKGEYRAGDRVVYCEIDSLLPERPEFDFLRAGGFKPSQVDPSTGATALPAGFRIKTARLRGQVSQGICFSLGILPEGTDQTEGADVTEALGILKWEPPIPVGMAGRVKGGFPAFLPKTDETRVQLLESTLERQRGQTFYVTEKLDGTSFSAFIREGGYGLCSRNLWIDETDDASALVRVARGLDLEAKLRTLRDRFRTDVAIQAEVIGPGVQGNKYALPHLSLRVFNLFDINAYRLVDHGLMLAGLKEVGLETVPQLGTLVLDHSIDALVAFAEGAGTLNPKTQREGVVLRPLVDEYDATIGGRLSFKAINPKFLLKYAE